MAVDPRRSMKWLGVLALCAVIIASASLSLFTVPRQFAESERALASEAADAEASSSYSGRHGAWPCR